VYTSDGAPTFAEVYDASGELSSRATTRAAMTDESEPDRFHFHWSPPPS
jgi:hypothetical protein